MSTVLNSIIEGVKEDLAVRKKTNPNISADLEFAPNPISALNALSVSGMSIIAEVKRSSPSKGNLAEISNPAELALSYEKAGASVVSVLTEERRFKGSIADFKEVRAKLSIPMLRKDFIVDEYQVIESRVIGADMQLLIVAALSQAELKDFYQMGAELGMDSLFEIHTAQELELAMALDPKIVGVNSRNLKTLEVDPKNFQDLIPMIPDQIIKVAESGISNRTEVAALEALGANAILVGETLVKAGDPAVAIKTLLGR
ncbi:MAG: hypothetical protein RL129_780 [Actinomycetota bacterium]|jgi:indole-3-glycerol phosphate synthase